MIMQLLNFSSKFRQEQREIFQLSTYTTNNYFGFGAFLMARKHLIQLLVLMPPFLLSAAPMAARAEEPDLFSLSLEQLSEIPVTGSTLTPNNLMDVPASVTVFTAEDIHKLPVHTLEDLMNYVPGLQSYRSSDTPLTSAGSVRGRRLSSSDREILVLLNGMKIDSYFTGGVSGSYASLPLDNIRRVEFIRGPGSAVYGSNAFTGVINIITDDQSRTVRVAAGSNRHLETTIQQAWDSPTISGHLMATVVDDNGQRFDVPDTFSNNTLSTRDPYLHDSVQLQLRFARDTRLQWVYAHNRSDGFYTLGTLDDSFNNFTINYSGLQLQQQLYWQENINSQLLLGAQFTNLLVDDRPMTVVTPGAISNPPSTEPMRVRTDITSTEYSLNWKNDWSLSADSSLQFGAEYRVPQITRGNAYSNYDLAQLAAHQLPINYYGDLSHTTQIVKEDRQDVLGLYVQHQYHINDRWDTIAGGRYDHYSQIGSHFSPRLGLVNHVSHNDSIKLLFGEAFRSPQATELYTINNPVQLGNPHLKPETVSTWEFIWLHQWQHSQLVLNYFYNLFKNAISLQPVAGVRQFVNNHEHERSDGVEAEWSAQFGTAWKFHLTATQLLDTPDAFFREARTLLSATSTYEQGNWYGTLTTYYRSRRETVISADGTLHRLKAYWQVEGKVGYRWSDQLETYGEILNALDKDYWTPTLTTFVKDGIPNRGRELRIGLNWDF